MTNDMPFSWWIKRIGLHVLRDGSIGFALGFAQTLTDKMEFVWILIGWCVFIAAKEVFKDPHPSWYFWEKTIMDICAPGFIGAMFFMLARYYIF